MARPIGTIRKRQAVALAPNVGDPLPILLEVEGEARRGEAEAGNKVRQHAGAVGGLRVDGAERGAELVVGAVAADADARASSTPVVGS